MRIHHATAKWASDHGIDLSAEGEMAVARKGKVEWRWTDAKTAARACSFAALIASDYPALKLDHDGSSWVVTCYRPEQPATEDNPDTVAAEWVSVWYGEEPPEVADLEDIAAACDEEGLDIEALFDENDEDDDKPGGSIVNPRYKVIYAERGDATNCGDWLANALKVLVPQVASNGRLVADVVTLDIVFRDNGAESLNTKWGRAYHDDAYRSNGWEGRFSMSGRNVLRKRVADAGYLIFGDERHMAPAEWCDEHRTAPKKAKKGTSDEQQDATATTADTDSAAA